MFKMSAEPLHISVKPVFDYYVFDCYSYDDYNFVEVDNGYDGERDVVFTGSSIDGNETMFLRRRKRIPTPSL